MSATAVYGGLVGGSDGALIGSVEPGGPAQRAGVAPGDVVVTANGRRLRDVIDWWWESDGASVEVELLTGATTRSVRLVRDAGETWGIEFADVIFDGVRTCRNACAFCFMAQLPRGLRRALYVRDDDYRLSFLQGNFVTLTNLGKTDVERIVEQHLSPLHVSVHAVTPAVRAGLVCARQDSALEVLDELLGSGIEVHGQIVLVPGMNDGEELDRTLGWLAEREGVVSVGVVPLGYTRHQSRFTRSYESAASAAQVLDQLEPWRSAFLKRDGVSVVHAADEFYLTAGRPLPPAAHYDGFPQYENGIGLVRVFQDRVASLLRQHALRAERVPGAEQRPVVVTGTLFSPVLEDLLQAHGLSGAVTVLPVTNDFFGGNVSVAGLLTGADVVRAVRAHGHRSRYLVPDAMFNADGLTLDDMAADELSQRAGVRIEPIIADADGLLSAIL